jgi:16S rRNA (guanine966-N2)-methyltransferase
VLLVESEAAALRVLRVNVASLALPGAEVAPVRVERLVTSPNSGAPYDLVFADPPYALSAAEIGAVLREIAAHGWLADDGLAVVERPSRGGELGWPESFLADRSRRYGEGTLWYGRAAPTN